MCSGVRWGQAATDTQNTSEADTCSFTPWPLEWKREKSCFPPTVKWIFDFDKICAGVCCSAVSLPTFPDDYIDRLFLRFCVEEVFCIIYIYIYSSPVVLVFPPKTELHVKCINACGGLENFAQSRKQKNKQRLKTRCRTCRLTCRLMQIEWRFRFACDSLRQQLITQ